MTAETKSKAQLEREVVEARRAREERELRAEYEALRRGELERQERAEREKRAAARDAYVRTLIEDRDHLRGCPGEADPSWPVEFFVAERPGDAVNRQKGQPGPVTVVRCQECGGSHVLDGRPEDNGIDVRLEKEVA